MNKELNGCLTADNNTVVEFTDTTSAIVELEENTVYRFAADQDCYFNIGADAVYTAADADSVILFKGIPEVVKTTKAYKYLSVIRVTDDGDLHVTKFI
jgi:hypothetical protein